MADKVVYLAWDNPSDDPAGEISVLACKNCQNKTYRIEVCENSGDGVYRATCAACGGHIGGIGWIDDGDLT